jgi:hypothetical protein
MLDRRHFIGTIPVSALAWTALSIVRPASAREAASTAVEPSDLIARPPVVQNSIHDGFGVSIAVSELATAWVEYGFAEDDLRFTAIASHHGLIAADDQALHVRIVPSPRCFQDSFVFRRGLFGKLYDPFVV